MSYNHDNHMPYIREMKRRVTGSQTGNKRNRVDDPLDRYCTPPYGTRLLYETLPVLRDYRTLDPCCGLGDMSNIARRHCKLEVVSADIRTSDRIAGIKGVNFLTTDMWRVDEFGNIMFNPPFNLSQQFTENALDLTKRFVCVLQRIQFLEGIKRYRSIFATQWLRWVYMFTYRMNFFREGQIDHRVSGQMSFAWFVLDKYHTGQAALDFIHYKPKQDGIDLLPQQVGVCEWCRLWDGRPVKCKEWKPCGESSRDRHLCWSWLPLEMVE